MSAPDRKQEEDFSPAVDALVERVDTQVATGNVDDAVAEILALEKKTRNANDNKSTGTLLTKLVNVLYATGRLSELNEKLVSLANKHGQLRTSTQKMTDAAITVLGHLEGTAKWDLVDTIRKVTEGKIYLELQRATVTRMLAEKKEAEREIKEAADLLSELQVETFTSMDIREKTLFILDQMRLLVDLHNWDELAIVSRRINQNWIKDDADLQVRYYNLMILLGIYTENYLDVAKHYMHLYHLPEIHDAKSEDGVAAWMPVLRNLAYFVILAPHDNEQHDMLHRLFTREDFRLKKDPVVYAALQVFERKELMRWPGLQATQIPELQKSRVFGPDSVPGLPGDIEPTRIPGLGLKRLDTLHKRLTEHNIRVVEAYYSRVSVDRLAQLLDLSTADADAAVADLVATGTVYARIDRPAGLVDFRKPKKGPEVLNEWSYDVSRLLSLVEDASHLIARDSAAYQNWAQA